MGVGSATLWRVADQRNCRFWARGAVTAPSLMGCSAKLPPQAAVNQQKVFDSCLKRNLRCEGPSMPGELVNINEQEAMREADWG
jgi:hypothetical protein